MSVTFQLSRAGGRALASAPGRPRAMSSLVAMRPCSAGDAALRRRGARCARHTDAATATVTAQAPVAHARRSVSSSAPRRASESPENVSMPPGMERIFKSPRAKAAIERLMSTLEAKGVDIKSGKPPGMMEMAKLAMASEVREATAEVMAALKEIGIEMTPDNMSKLMSGDRSALESQHGKGNDGKDK